MVVEAVLFVVLVLQLEVVVEHLVFDYLYLVLVLLDEGLSLILI